LIYSFFTVSNCYKPIYSCFFFLTTTTTNIKIIDAQCWGDICEAGVDLDGDWRDSWRALSAFVANGTVRSLGVSNFDLPTLRQLLALIEREQLAPLVVVQDWADPFHQALERRRFCAQHSIALQAYSPLGGQYWSRTVNPVTSSDALQTIGARRNRTASQITLQWFSQLGIVSRCLVCKAQNKNLFSSCSETYLCDT
jgi:diketogulonate reductase-like aldo/keto reductase